jgi:nucleotide-binding universal stress UspA family protein
MDCFSRVLIAVDGSAAAARATAVALSLANGSDDCVRFISVYERDEIAARSSSDMTSGEFVGELLQEAHVACEAALTVGARAAVVSGTSADVRLRTGSAVEEILKEATAWLATAVAVGTERRVGFVRVFFGSCAQAVLRHSDVPVLIANDRATPCAGRLHVLCAVDGSPAAFDALASAVGLVRARKAVLHVVAVVEIADADAVAYQSDAFDPDGTIAKLYADTREILVRRLAATHEDVRDVVVHVLGGENVAEIVVGCAESYACGLIMVGTHGRGGVARTFLGSTAEGIIQAAGVPVLAFRDARERMPAPAPAAVLA